MTTSLIDFILQLRTEAAYLYDAVWLYARTAHKILEQGGDIRNGTLIIENLINVTYKSRTTVLFIAHWSAYDTT